MSIDVWKETVLQGFRGTRNALAIPIKKRSECASLAPVAGYPFSSQ